MSEERRKPDIQLLANIVLHDAGKVLLTKYDDEDERWWLPGAELLPYEHPDEAVQRALTNLQLDVATQATSQATAKLHHIESFRGRRGWHVMFNYSLGITSGAALRNDIKWFDIHALPATAHGAWEKGVISKILS